MLVAGERVRVGAAFEQEPRRLDMAEEAGEPERLEAVVAERVRSGRLFVQQLAYPLCPAERSGLEHVQLRVAREQPGHVVAAVERFEQLAHRSKRERRRSLSRRPPVWHSGQ